MPKHKPITLTSFTSSLSHSNSQLSSYAIRKLNTITNHYNSLKFKCSKNRKSTSQTQIHANQNYCDFKKVIKENYASMFELHLMRLSLLDGNFLVDGNNSLLSNSNNLNINNLKTKSSNLSKNISNFVSSNKNRFEYLKFFNSNNSLKLSTDSSSNNTNLNSNLNLKNRTKKKLIPSNVLLNSKRSYLILMLSIFNA